MANTLAAVAASQQVDGATPSWLDQLQPASFRGVQFQVDSIDWTAGDNVVVRQYPFQDLPTIFRMGAGAETLRLSAYVIGPDYHLQRDALMRALSGLGVLVHPTAGAMRVWPSGQFQVREAPAAEGGMARIDVTFVRADAQREPVATTRTAAAVATAAANVQQAAGDAYVARVDATRPKPGWVADRVIGRLQASLGSSWARISAAAKSLGEFNSQVIGAYNTLRAGLDTALSAPRNLVANLRTLVALPTELTSATARDLRAAFAFMGTQSQTAAAPTTEVLVSPALGAGVVVIGAGTNAALANAGADGVLLASLTGAVDQLQECLAVAAYAQAAAAIELTSYDEALAMRAWLTAQTNRLLLAASAEPAAAEASTTALHDALLALQAAALADLQARGQDLVRLSSFTPEGWMPVWAVSYRLFGTTAWADEILAMNPHIQHPLLVPPGVPVRVVRHG